MTKMNLNHFISAMNFSYSESAPYDVFSADELGGGIGGGTFPMLWDWSADEGGGGAGWLLAQGAFAMLCDWSEVGAGGGGGGGTAL